MAKKSTKAPAQEPKTQIKFRIGKEDHRRLKVAAAIQEKSLAEFCLDAVEEQIAKTLKGVALPDQTQ